MITEPDPIWRSSPPPPIRPPGRTKNEGGWTTGSTVSRPVEAPREKSRAAIIQVLRADWPRRQIPKITAAGPWCRFMGCPRSARPWPVSLPFHWPAFPLAYLSIGRSSPRPSGHGRVKKPTLRRSSPAIAPIAGAIPVEFPTSIALNIPTYVLMANSRLEDSMFFFPQMDVSTNLPSPGSCFHKLRSFSPLPSLKIGSPETRRIPNATAAGFPGTAGRIPGL